jgi:hypothetical protein
MNTSRTDRCEQNEMTRAYALQALPRSEVPAAEAILARARIASANWRACDGKRPAFPAFQLRLRMRSCGHYLAS